MNTPFDSDDDSDFPPPGWDEMDADEKHECAQAHLARLRRRREELLAQGPDTAYFVEELDREIRPFEKAVNYVQAKIDARDAAFETYLQAMADRVDTTNEASENLQTMVEWLSLLLADDPAAAEAKARLDAIAKEFPAEPARPKRTLAELEAELRKRGLLPPPPSGPSGDNPAPPA